MICPNCGIDELESITTSLDECPICDWVFERDAVDIPFWIPECWSDWHRKMYEVGHRALPS